MFSLSIATLFTSIIAICSSLFLSQQFPSQPTQTQTPTITETELEDQPDAKLYKAWRSAFDRGDALKMLSLGKQYLEQFPQGQSAKYIKMWCDVIQRDLDRRRDAEENGLRQLLEETTSDQTKVLAILANDLIDAKSDVNIRIKGGKTALMLASATGDAESVKRLIKRGADVNAKESTNGWTALIYGIWNGDSETVEALIESGADMELRDSKGRTALDHAKISGRTGMIELIKKAGGRK